MSTEKTTIPKETTFPSVAELRRLVKKRERLRFSAMWFLEPIQAYLSYVLIRMGLNSLQVTVLWLVVALAGYAVTMIGTPLAFIGGCLLLYLKTILDGCDGEVARYQKQFVSDAEDLESFIHGVYLDKAFHIIEKPLWGLSLAMGLYRMTGEAWIFAAGVSLAVFQGFCRHNSTLQKDIPRQFAERVRNLPGESDKPATASCKHDSIPVRVLDKVFMFMRNGKRFNLLIALCAMADLIGVSANREPMAVLGLVTAAGAIAPLLMTYVIYRTVSTGVLIERCRSC